ncbi:MAG TPA: HNH endonuclease [Verrucomicrobiae bacterium]|nr:HNH endonuclease [Verrucomicrobiae bacterium]
MPSPFAIEHILPQSRGGGNDIANLAYCCPGCNGHKARKIAGIDPATRALAPLFNPRSQRWDHHFRWASEGTRIEGLSPTGGATIAALRLNREGLINLRRLMVSAGLHPPKR